MQFALHHTTHSNISIFPNFRFHPETPSLITRLVNSLQVERVFLTKNVLRAFENVRITRIVKWCWQVSLLLLIIFFCKGTSIKPKCLFIIKFYSCLWTKTYVRYWLPLLDLTYSLHASPPINLDFICHFLYHFTLSLKICDHLEEIRITLREMPEFEVCELIMKNSNCFLRINK